MPAVDKKDAGAARSDKTLAHPQLSHHTIFRRTGRVAFHDLIVQCMSLVMAQLRPKRTGRARPLCPGRSDVDLFRYCESIINFDAKVSDGTLDLGMPEQELNRPQVACSPIDQGRLGSSE